MGFPDSIRREVLTRSRRRCCVCHAFAGRNIHVHHINPEAEGGADDLQNAIALCFRCHAEAGHYNPKHPLGTKYSREELRTHRDKWWEHCEAHPEECAGYGLDITHHRDASSNADVHTYWLSIAFRNDSPAKQSGYSLDLLFPVAIPIEYRRNDYVSDDSVILDEMSWMKLALQSSDTIYRGQTVQIVDENRNPVSYQMNHELYRSDRGRHWTFRCNFHVGNLPAVREVLPWDEMHGF